MENNDAVAIVVTYNRYELLQECICALKKIDDVDILVIDNASTDNTSDIQREKDIMYYNTGKNIGGAGGFNYGIRKAYDLGYEYYWIMDDDTIVNNESFYELKKSYDLLNGECGFLSSIALWKDGKACAMNYHKIDREWNDTKELLINNLLRINVATFVSFYFSKKVLESIGLPIKEYFIWGDDTEYSLRISSKYPCYLCTHSVVLHKMQSNQSSKAFYKIVDRERIKRMYYSIRNDECTSRRRGHIEHAIYIAKWIIKLCQVLFKSEEHKLLKLRILFKGLLDGIFFRPKIENVK